MGGGALARRPGRRAAAASRRSRGARAPCPRRRRRGCCARWCSRGRRRADRRAARGARGRRRTWPARSAWRSASRPRSRSSPPAPPVARRAPSAAHAARRRRAGRRRRGGRGRRGVPRPAGASTRPPRARSPRCNGHAALCDRPLDEIVMPATHNSMSAPLPGWLSAEQERSIGGQLQDGIRGLLIDTHYGDRLANGRVRTVLGDRVAQGEDGVSAQQAGGRRAPARAARLPRQGRARHVPVPLVLRARRHAAGRRAARHPRLPRHPPRRGRLRSSTRTT